MTRSLTPEQQALAESCLRYVQPCIAMFVKRNPDLRPSCRRVDLESIAYQAVCMASMTYNPERSKPCTYFGSAIRHALYREVLSQAKQDGRYICVQEILDPQPNIQRTRQEQRAIKALRLLSAYDRLLLEDRMIESITLEQLGDEQGIDPRTIQKRVQAAIEKLRNIESNLP